MTRDTRDHLRSALLDEATRPLTAEERRRLLLAYRDGVLEPGEAVLIEAARIVAERTRAAVEEWRETALKFSDDYHAELNRRIDAEAKVARVEALLAEAEAGAESWGACGGEWLRLDRLREAVSDAAQADLTASEGEAGVLGHSGGSEALRGGESA